MSCQDKSAIQQAVVDSLEFARKGGHLAGSVAVAALGRLADALADTGGELAYSLDGGRNGDGKPFLHLRVSGRLQLSCQRCLSALPFEVEIDSRLLLVAPGEAWPDDELVDDGSDAIEADAALAVLPLIEDEVLLALPIAPRHGDCRPPQADGGDKKPSPFAALASLKKH